LPKLTTTSITLRWVRVPHKDGEPDRVHIYRGTALIAEFVPRMIGELIVNAVNDHVRLRRMLKKMGYEKIRD